MEDLKNDEVVEVVAEKLLSDESWSKTHLTKAERKGKSYSEIQELRKEKFQNKS